MRKITLLCLLLAFNIGFTQDNVTHYNISNNTSNTPIENKQDSSAVIKDNNKDWLCTEKSVERSFRFANWALVMVTLIFTIFGVFFIVKDLLFLKYQRFSEKFRDEIRNQEKLREEQDKKHEELRKIQEQKFEEQMSSVEELREEQGQEFKKQISYIEELKFLLNQKMEFNFTAAEASFRAMDYFSSIVINKNPGLDPKKEFLKKMDETRSILYLYHEDKEARKRALKDLQYSGSNNSLDILDKYRKEINDPELEQLAKKASEAILKKEGAREAKEKEEREGSENNL